jgi:type I restriction enzyme M protein
MNPGPGERILDCASGTGTFLAMAAVHLFNRLLSETYATTPEEAAPEVLLLAQQQVRGMVSDHFFGCEMDPDLAVTSRLNVLFTVGQPAQVFLRRRVTCMLRIALADTGNPNCVLFTIVFQLV